MESLIRLLRVERRYPECRPPGQGIHVAVKKRYLTVIEPLKRYR